VPCRYSAVLGTGEEDESFRYNPKSYILNPKLQTQNPKFHTLSPIPQPLTLNPKS